MEASEWAIWIEQIRFEGREREGAEKKREGAEKKKGEGKEGGKEKRKERKKTGRSKMQTWLFWDSHPILSHLVPWDLPVGEIEMNGRTGPKVPV